MKLYLIKNKIDNFMPDLFTHNLHEILNTELMRPEYDLSKGNRQNLFEKNIQNTMNDFVIEMMKAIREKYPNILFGKKDLIHRRINIASGNANFSSYKYTLLLRLPQSEKPVQIGFGNIGFELLKTGKYSRTTDQAAKQIFVHATTDTNLNVIKKLDYKLNSQTVSRMLTFCDVNIINEAKIEEGDFVAYQIVINSDACFISKGKKRGKNCFRTALISFTRRYFNNYTHMGEDEKIDMTIIGLPDTVEEFNEGIYKEVEKFIDYHTLVLILSDFETGIFEMLQKFKMYHVEFCADYFHYRRSFNIVLTKIARLNVECDGKKSYIIAKYWGIDFRNKIMKHGINSREARHILFRIIGNLYSVITGEQTELFSAKLSSFQSVLGITGYAEFTKLLKNVLYIRNTFIYQPKAYVEPNQYSLISNRYKHRPGGADQLRQMQNAKLKFIQRNNLQFEVFYNAKRKIIKDEQLRNEYRKKYKYFVVITRHKEFKKS